jgi:hypothetical protein
VKDFHECRRRHDNRIANVNLTQKAIFHLKRTRTDMLCSWAVTGVGSGVYLNTDRAFYDGGQAHRHKMHRTADDPTIGHTMCDYEAHITSTCSLL